MKISENINVYTMDGHAIMQTYVYIHHDILCIVIYVTVHICIYRDHDHVGLFWQSPITLYLTHWFTWLTGSPSSSLAQLVKATTRFPVSKRGNAEDTKLHSSSDG